MTVKFTDGEKLQIINDIIANPNQHIHTITQAIEQKGGYNNVSADRQDEQKAKDTAKFIHDNIGAIPRENVRTMFMSSQDTQKEYMRLTGITSNQLTLATLATLADAMNHYEEAALKKHRLDVTPRIIIEGDFHKAVLTDKQLKAAMDQQGLVRDKDMTRFGPLGLMDLFGQQYGNLGRVKGQTKVAQADGSIKPQYQPSWGYEREITYRNPKDLNVGFTVVLNKGEESIHRATNNHLLIMPFSADGRIPNPKSLELATAFAQKIATSDINQKKSGKAHDNGVSVISPLPMVEAEMEKQLQNSGVSVRKASVQMSQEEYDQMRTSAQVAPTPAVTPTPPGTVMSFENNTPAHATRTSSVTDEPPVAAHSADNRKESVHEAALPSAHYDPSELTFAQKRAVFETSVATKSLPAAVVAAAQEERKKITDSQTHAAPHEEHGTGTIKRDRTQSARF